LPSGAQLTELDLALVPSTLGGAMSVLPSLDNLGLLNGGPGARAFALPDAGAGARWRLVLDTACDTRTRRLKGPALRLAPHSLVLLELEAGA
jgi:hypothetical protein